MAKGSFEESVYLLLEGELPNPRQLQSFCQELARHSLLEEPILRHLKTYPKGVHRMDFLMTTLSFARMFDEDYGNATWQMPKNDEILANLVLSAGVHHSCGTQNSVYGAGQIKNQAGRDGAPVH